MSVEAKIKELLGNKPEQLQEEAKEDLTAAGMADTGAKASMNMKKDNSKASVAANAGDATQPMQGSSQKATFDEMDEDEANLGGKSAGKVSKDTTLPTSKGDAKTVKTQAMEETETQEETTISEVSIKDELSAIFGEDLSEEFRTKATSIFEAAVIARVNSEMEKVVEKLEEQNAEQLQQFKDTMVDKIDGYLNYVVEQWMEENQIAVDAGLRTEITEEFMSGLKTLFKENYIEVPEEKYDVLGDLTGKVDELESKLDESIQDNVELAKQIVELKKKAIFEEQTKDLASTEVEKFSKLVEGVEYDSDELFQEKLSVIKENYFPKEAGKSSTQQTLVEENSSEPVFETSDVMSRYAQAISRTVKSR